MEDDLVRQYAALIKKRERLTGRPRLPSPIPRGAPARSERPSQQLTELNDQETTVIMKWEVLGLDLADLERRAREFNADQEDQEEAEDAE